MSWDWLEARTFEVPCTVDIENTLDSLHAYVELEGSRSTPATR